MTKEQLAHSPDPLPNSEQGIQHDVSASWARLFPTGALFLLAYLVFFLASKLIGFTTGYALDDYPIVRQANNASLVDFFLSQGRYGNALMETILHACNLTMSSFSTIGLTATALFSGLFYKDTLALPAKAPKTLAIGLGAFLGAHPYYTEYVSFRQAALPMSLMFVGMWLSLRFYRKAFQIGAGRISALISSLLIATLIMGTNQLAVSFLAIAALCVHIQRLQNGEFSKASRTFAHQTWLIPIAHAVLVGAALIVCNQLVAKLTLVAFDITSNQRTALVPLDMLSQRGNELIKLLPVLWAKSETVASWPPKALALAAFIILLATSLRKHSPYARLAIVTFLAATAAALIPVAASEAWWPVPRTLIAIPFALAVSIGVLAPVASSRQPWVGIMLIVSGFIFAAHSQSILFNQQRLNRWDQMQARDISQLAAAKFPEVASKLAIVEPRWSHDIAQEITQGDLNVSALSVPWAIDSLFDESTGRDQQVRLAPEFGEICASSPKYPDPASMHLEKDEVIVCLH